MGRHSIITQGNVLEAVRVFRWITRSALAMYFGGEEKRIKSLEIILPYMERTGKLNVDWHKGEKVYSLPRKKKIRPVSMDHEVACADIAVRLWRCRMDESEIFPERAFRGFGIVPEGGFKYGEDRNSMLVFEYCTNSNFHHSSVMKSKITRYKKHLPAIESKFNRNVTVLFVIDIERNKVRNFVTKVKPLLDDPVISGLTYEQRYPFFFTGYQTFTSVPVGESLKAKIYFWKDGQEWSLTDDA